jgi:hypothetical protein
VFPDFAEDTSSFAASAAVIGQVRDVLTPYATVEAAVHAFRDDHRKATGNTPE